MHELAEAHAALDAAAVAWLEAKVKGESTLPAHGAWDEARRRTNRVERRIRKHERKGSA